MQATKTTTKTEQFTGTVTEAKLVEATVCGIDRSARRKPLALNTGKVGSGFNRLLLFLQMSRILNIYLY